MKQFELSKEYQNFLDFLLKASDFTEQVTEDTIFNKFRKYIDEEME